MMFSIDCWWFIALCASIRFHSDRVALNSSVQCSVVRTAVHSFSLIKWLICALHTHTHILTQQTLCTQTLSFVPQSCSVSCLSICVYVWSNQCKWCCASIGSSENTNKPTKQNLVSPSFVSATPFVCFCFCSGKPIPGISNLFLCHCNLRHLARFALNSTQALTYLAHW